ncbi:MAG: hypothetical protein ACRCST_06085 [Turicibacter sp.]
MNNKQIQFLDFILKRVQDNKVDEARELVSDMIKKLENGTYTRTDIGELIPRMTILIKTNKVDEVHDAIQAFAASFEPKQN